MKISKQTVKRFQEATGLYLYFSVSTKTISFELEDLVAHQGLTLGECGCLQILGFLEEQYVCIQFKTPQRKEITFEYLMDKVSKVCSMQSCYKNLSDLFCKLLPNYSSRFFPTTYGLGFDTFLLTDAKVQETTKSLSDFLKSKQIAFENEYSDARWVYRFKISKAKKNIERLKKILEA